MQNNRKVNKPMLYYSVFEKLEYLIKFKLEKDKIHITIQENNEFVPYTYEGFFSQEDFINRHIAFKSCLNIEEILEHLYNLYNIGKVFIGDFGYDDHRYMNFKVMFIDKEVDTQHFDLKRKMVEDKDEALIELYQEQKIQIEKIKIIEKLLNDKEMDKDLLKKKILEAISSESI